MKYTVATCVKQTMATSDENAAHRSAIPFCFPSVLTPFATFCQLKSTEHRVFEEHLYILGMVDLATLARIKHIVVDRSTRIAE